MKSGRPVRAELLRHDVIQRGADRLGVELVAVSKLNGSLPLGVTGCRVKYDPTTFRWGSFPCPRPVRAVVVLRPLVHRANAARDEELAGIRRERREARRREVAGRQRAVRLRREALGRDAPVVREHHDQLLRLGGCLPLRRAAPRRS